MSVFSDAPGIEYTSLNNWREFLTFIDEVKKHYQYIWRGQSDSEWDLVSSFNRLFNNYAHNHRMLETAKRHLDRFKYIARGRIDYDVVCEDNDDEMWALAQHYGLATPLLDWTYSPFVALFFAIHDQLGKNPDVSIWSLANLSKLNTYADSHGIPKIERFNPRQRKNSRLISQNALFTKVPFNFSVNSWVENIVSKSNQEDELVYIMKIDIKFSKNDIRDCLIFLNRMNINYYTLFPDAQGATNFCNMAFKIPRYHSFW